MNIPTNLEPGQKRACNLRTGQKVWMDGRIVELANVVNRWSGGGLGCTDLYWKDGKSGGASERVISLACEDMADFINDLEITP